MHKTPSTAERIRYSPNREYLKKSLCTPVSKNGKALSLNRYVADSKGIISARTYTSHLFVALRYPSVIYFIVNSLRLSSCFLTCSHLSELLMLSDAYILRITASRLRFYSVTYLFVCSFVKYARSLYCLYLCIGITFCACTPDGIKFFSKFIIKYKVHIVNRILKLLIYCIQIKNGL